MPPEKSASDESSENPVVHDEQAFAEALSEALDAPDTPDEGGNDNPPAETAETTEASETPETPGAPEQSEPPGNPDAPEAVQDPAPAEASEKDDDQSEGEQPAPGSAEDDGDISEEDLAALSKSQTDRRTRQVIRQRAKFKQQAETLETQQAELARAAGLNDAAQLTAEYLADQTQAAQGFKNLENYMGQNKLAPSDVQTGLQAMAAITHGDWNAFQKIVGPYIEIMQGQLGGALPQDVQAMVDNGEMSAERAAEFAKQRADRSAFEIQAQRASAQADQMATQSQTTAAQNAQAHQARIRAEVNRWQQETARTDPDFEKKASLVHDRLAARVTREGNPRDVQTALEWAKEAHAHVTNLLRPATQSAQPPRSPASAMPPAGPTSTNVQPKAETFEQAMLNALAS